MTECRHQQLLLLRPKSSRVQCRHCHLTIGEDELGDGYCPECYEVHDEKRYDFVQVESAVAEKVTYRCEECGILIECG